MKRAFKMKKSFFIIFKGLSIKQTTQIFLEGKSPTLRGTKSKHQGNFYCLNCLYSFATENKRKYHKKVSENKNFGMPSDDLKYLLFIKFIILYILYTIIFYIYFI